ncbi:phosphate transporter family protein [Capnocytophaga sp. oral taxon 863 str. F0517]|uniref:inorganic phosphate transporter n=1 Tax=Capnocytophaga sp. oral taxon 863 TaxID=1227265 RepID=UPI0003975603|nr:inorganic phosphate transporter [Capnocytophaga sp. oral taxon 863]ERI64783.1 phosphate transporter family protein [Capnocytophaga sp. oral taxon 863 str. F0517]
MEQVYIFTLSALFLLATFDLIVGVSNDAVNFLNSAFSSRAARLRTIMIVASIGVGIGAIFSNGMMEIAKKGIFNPEMFYFEELMVIFAAVMLADIVLLDFFNTMGLPTSTTISIVFELLGASVGVAFVKELKNKDRLLHVIDGIREYINTDKVGIVILAIFVSVFIAFVVGSFVQFITRIIFTFDFERRMRYFSGIVGGIALTALSYFLVIKGLSGLSFMHKEQLDWIGQHMGLLLGGFFIAFFLLGQLLYWCKISIWRVVILSGTFALAMAFAGNDLVNFIGVPVAAWDSFQLWKAAGTPVQSMTMEGLRENVQTPQIFLIIAGALMILTIWFSKKALNVMQTEMKLSQQGGGKERFEATGLSRGIVRFSVWVTSMVEALIPKRTLEYIESRLKKPEEKDINSPDKPAYDVVRAAINLVVSSSLIAVGTSLKLPLSTTYVSFMVAMGTSLADRAWGRESAVFRVAGVFNVIGGWFLTAGAAFVMGLITAVILFYGEIYGLISMIFLVGYLVVRNAMAYRRKQRKEKEAQKKRFNKEDLITISGIMKLSSQNIAGAVQTIDELYREVIDNLAVENHKGLKACKKRAKALTSDIEDLKSDIYYFIRSIDDSSVTSSKFYILILDYLHSMSNSISFIADTSYIHVDNNHKKLKYNHIRNLKNISEKMQLQFQKILEILNVSMYSNSTTQLIKDVSAIKDEISELIEKQIRDIRTTESSPKNTKLYFSLLLETRVLIRSIINLMTLFKNFKDQYKLVSNN